MGLRGPWVLIERAIAVYRENIYLCTYIYKEIILTYTYPIIELDRLTASLVARVCLVPIV